MRSRTRLFLDLVLAAGLVAAYYPRWTGIPVHQWLSIAILLPLLVHLVVNWQWAVRVAIRFLERLVSASRVNFVVDSALLVATVTVVLSGFMVSPDLLRPFGVAVAPSLAWHTVHSWSANATISLVLLHGVLHWRWALGVVRRMAAPPPRRAPRPALAGAGSARGRARQAHAERAAAWSTVAVLGVTGVVAVSVFATVVLAAPGPASSRVPSGAGVKSASEQTCPATGCAGQRCHGASGAKPDAFYSKAELSAGRKAAARRPARPLRSARRSPMAGPKTSRKALLAFAKPRKTVSARTFVVPPKPGALVAGSGAKTATAASGARAAAAPKPASKKALKTAGARKRMTCPVSGCSASSCHGAHGVSARTWYATH